MARIRTIKPEFPHSESMGRVSRESRLCFILLWTIADDAGRLRGNSRMLSSLLYPYDDDAKNKIDTWLTQLCTEGCIARYDAEGTSYIQVMKWADHQKIDKPSASRLPAFDESSRVVANVREVSATDLGPRTVDLGMEGNGFGDAKRRTRLPADFYPDETGITAFAVTGLSLAVELEKFRNHHKAKGSVMLDWQAAWRTWAGNAAQFQPAKTRQSAQAQTIEALTGGLASAKGSHALALT